MRKHFKLYGLSLLLILGSCTGSSTYQGVWKATDLEDGQFEIRFEAKSLVIFNAEGDSTQTEYHQNSVNISNEVETYGIKLNDGRSYQITFPFADESTGFINDMNGNLLYTINRNDYVRYEDVVKLHKG
jgi:hypothetical protein